MTRVLQVCLNGSRSVRDHPGVPIDPGQLAQAAAVAVAAGAQDIHLHPKDADGEDTLQADAVARALLAVRVAVPGLSVGVTTGAWTERDPVRRAALVRTWTVRPDHASVNWHEPGAELVAQALTDVGVRVHAGIFSGTQGAALFAQSGWASRVERILAEVVRPPRAEAALAARDLLTAIGRTQVPVLLHGEGDATWPVLGMAALLGLDTRVGLEDTLTLPDGQPAADNAELVRTALRLVRATPSER